jgi:hypothetical protein
LTFDLEPVLLTVFVLAIEGRLLSSAFMGKPMLSSLLPVPGRPKPGDGWVKSSVESSKKLLQTLFAMVVPLLPDDHGAICELALVAVGGTRDIEGTRPPDVSSTASCFLWSPNAFVLGASQLGFRSLLDKSFGGGAGGTVPGEMSDSFSMLHHGVSKSLA